MNCCELRLVTKSQYNGKRERTPAIVRRMYTSRRAGSARAQRMAREGARGEDRARATDVRAHTGARGGSVLDIGLQPAELDDGDRHGHDEQDDGLGAGQTVAAELEGGAVDQLDDRDRGVV